MSRRRSGMRGGAPSGTESSYPAFAISLLIARDLWHNCYTHMQGTQRAHILIPADLLREIDAIVGPRGRSAFLLETAREEVRRRKLLRFLDDEEPAWQDRDHAELQKGSAAWVRKLRSLSEDRVLRVAAPANAPRKPKAARSTRRPSASSSSSVRKSE